MIYLTSPLGHLLGISLGDLLISTTPATSPSIPSSCFLWIHPHLGKRQLCLWNSLITLVRNLEVSLISSIFLISSFDLLGKSISSFFRAGPELITFHFQLCSYLIQATLMSCLGVAIITLPDLSSFLLAPLQSGLHPVEWTFENIIQIMWLPCSQLSSGFSSHWDEKKILTTTCKTTPSGSLPPLWHESLSPPYSLHLHHIWCCSDMAIAFLPWGLCSSSCTLSAFPPGSHLAYSFTSFWPLLRRHAWNIIAALEGGNSWKKEIQSVSQKMNSKAVLQIYSTLSPLHTNEFHSESVCTTPICF